MSKNTARGVERFNVSPKIAVPRSKFDLSHGHKTTLRGGYLVPVLNMDLLPGDSIKCDLRQLCRMATPIVPFMDRVRMSYFAFAVPKRLLWSHWEDYITGSHNGKLGTTHTLVPQAEIPLGGATSDPNRRYAGDIFDYMGIPHDTTVAFQNTPIQVNALPLRAYNLVWNTWFRDQNLQDEIPLDIGDVDTANHYELLKRGKRKDYFTSALPWPQKGPAVSIGSGSGVQGFCPVVTRSEVADATVGKQMDGLRWTVSTTGAEARGTALLEPYPCITMNGHTVMSDEGALSHSFSGSAVKPRNLWADISGGGIDGVTVNTLREAFAVQRLLEATARCGSRYVELLDGVYGVTSPDFRLQRPEYIGGGRIDFDVNTVAQTSASDPNSEISTPQGNLAAYAVSTGKVAFQYTSTEHQVLLVLACVTTDLTYQQGLDRMWTRKERTDEFFPEFAHLGEQPIREKEIFLTGNTADDDKVFGYQERFAEYKYMPSRLSGYMRSYYTGTGHNIDPSLDWWHLAQRFDAPPSLSADFIEENPPFDRVMAVRSEDNPDQFILDIWFDMKAIRPLPLYSVSGMIDHF